MNEQIREIAMRLSGLREVLDIPVEEMAATCNISVEDYLGYESGKTDIPIGVLQNVSKKIPRGVNGFVVWRRAQMKSYFLTRAGQGPAIERSKAYKYQALATGFVGRKADPFIVTVEPEEEEKPMHLNSHNGQELDFVLEGRMLLSVGGHELVLNEGDSLYFDATQPHGMKALDGKTVRFLATIF